jgi:uncharacterized protein
MLTVTGVVAVIAVVLGLTWALQGRLMFFPDTSVPLPGSIGLTGVEEVTFRTAEGLTLGAWFFPAPVPSARSAVLVFNGNAGNRAYRAPLAMALRRHEFHVMLLDYRGYGGNPGTPTEDGLASDARAARTYLTSRRDVDAARVAYFGESLGTAVAVRLAEEHPPAGLILRSPFTSMVDIGQHHYGGLPVRWLLRDRFAAIDRISRVHAPLLVIAGDKDRVVPLEYSRRLFDAAPEPKKLVVIAGADHNDAALLAGKTMIDAIIEFLEPIM